MPKKSNDNKKVDLTDPVIYKKKILGFYCNKQTPYHINPKIHDQFHLYFPKKPRALLNQCSLQAYKGL